MNKKILKFLASLKLAVIVLVALATVIAAGTIVESRYDAQAAAKLVYHTWFMYAIMGTLAVNLTAVMVDRWPWKTRHIPFILAHIGILILLLGAVITMEFGLDGTMRFGIGEKNRFVTVAATDLQVWSSFDGDRYSKIMDQQVDFFKKSPKDKPVKVSLPEGDLVVDDYEPYVVASRQIVATPSAQSGSAIRFQIQNDRVNLNEWILQTRAGANTDAQFGPARVALGKAPDALTAENVIYLTPKNDQEVSYVVSFRDTSRKPLKGTLKEGGSFPTGWMGLQFRMLRYFPHAEETYDFKKMDHPTALTTSAVHVTFKDKKYWVQLNDVLKIFTDQAAYILSYGNQRVDLKFDLFLKKFEVGRYQGTMRAASYQSLVTTPDGKDTLISMNEPLKYSGLTFYQASFQEGPDNQPTASILSVNYDPGRWIKYLGSLVITIGIVWLFYNKRKSARAQAPRKGEL
jgi:hypothetical protein